MKLNGKRALVTGASSGIGRCIAKRLSGMGAEVVLCARREALLKELAAEIERATPLPMDLAAPGAAQSLFERTEGAGQPVDVLINAAGFAVYGPFLDTPWERLKSMLELNVMALTGLTHLFGGAMKERGHGHIMNVSSFAAYSPVPRYAAYAASKTYVRDFSEAIAYELAPHGVRVCCLCPGATRTEFWEVAGHQTRSILIRSTMSSPDKVARIGLRALFGRRRNVVAGFPNKASAWATRFLPRGLGVRLAALISGR